MATYTAKSSGYLAAAAAVTWASGGPNSLATNTYSGMSDEIDNSTTGYTHADLYMDLGSAAFTGAGSAPTTSAAAISTWLLRTFGDVPVASPLL